MNDITLQDLLDIWPEKNPGESDMPDFCEGRPNTDGVILTTDFYSDMSVMTFEVVDRVYLWNICVVLEENNPDRILYYGREYLTIGAKSRYIKLLRSKDAECIASGVERHLDKCCSTRDPNELFKIRN